MIKQTKKCRLASPIIIFICLFLLPLSAFSEMRNKNKLLAGTPPFEIVKNILAGNEIAVEKYTAPRKGYAPLITWLTDSDARIGPHLIIKSPKDAIYTCRNMGAQLEVAAGQVEYGIRHLHTPVLLITLDSNNQAIRFLMEGYIELAPAIKRELDHLHLPMTKDKKKETFQERLIQNIEANIDYQVAEAISLYKDRVEMGRLTVIGTVVDFDNVYKRGAGRLIIINVDGEKDDAKLKSLQMMTSVSPQLRNMSIGRKRVKPVSPKKEGE